jgi:hypothetical protein
MINVICQIEGVFFPVGSPVNNMYKLASSKCMFWRGEKVASSPSRCPSRSHVNTLVANGNSTGLQFVTVHAVWDDT